MAATRTRLGSCTTSILPLKLPPVTSCSSMVSLGTRASPSSNSPPAWVTSSVSSTPFLSRMACTSSALRKMRAVNLAALVSITVWTNRSRAAGLGPLQMM